MGTTNPPQATMGTAINQTSDARLLSVNSIDDLYVLTPSVLWQEWRLILTAVFSDLPSQTRSLVTPKRSRLHGVSVRLFFLSSHLTRHTDSMEAALTLHRAKEQRPCYPRWCPPSCPLCQDTSLCPSPGVCPNIHHPQSSINPILIPPFFQGSHMPLTIFTPFS